VLLRAVDYVRPGSLTDAIQALESVPGARVLAGGQSLVNVLKHRAADVDLLVDVSRLGDLLGISVGADGDAEIGAAVTYDALDRHAALRAAQPTAADVAGSIADQQVRCHGTIGGNACFNDPGSNFPPLLVAVGATMHVSGPDGERDVPAEDFFEGAYQVALRPGELLRSIGVPPVGDAGIGYESLQLARDSWAIARAVAYVRGAGAITEARVVLGCVGGKPVRARAVEERLAGARPTTDAVAAAAAAASEDIDPPGDVHASAGYRREMARVVTRRALLTAVATKGG
jgi:carbon-monoxide dehydrogenase medium subunit